MRRIHMKIKAGEQSSTVGLIQKSLQALGFKIDDAERRTEKAGDSTIRAVRELQQRHNIGIQDDILVEDGTVKAMEAELRAAGQKDPSASFTVTGRLFGLDAKPQAATPVSLFEVSLKGVQTFSAGLKSTDELSLKNGFSLLAQAMSNTHGEYSLTLQDWLLMRRDRFSAQVIVFATEGKKVLGRSHLLQPVNYLKTGIAKGIDIATLPASEETEYERASREIAPVLKQAEADLTQVAASQEQVEFVAAAAHLKRDVVQAAAAAAAAFGELGRQDHESLYALYRHGLNLDPRTVAKQSDEQLHRQLQEASKLGTIRKQSDDERSEFIKRLKRTADKQHLQRKHEKLGGSLDDFLSAALPEAEQRSAFVQAVNAFRGTKGETFWQEWLPKQPGFRDQPVLVENLLFTQQLTLLTGNHAPLIKAIQSRNQIHSVADLAKLSRDDWLTLVKRAGVPAAVPGDDDEKRAARYIRAIETVYDAAFPTLRIRQAIVDDELNIGDTKVTKALATVMAAPDFDIAKSNVDTFQELIAGIAGDKAQAANLELKRIQRLYQVSPNQKALATLHKAGLSSSHAIASIPQQTFIQRYADALGGDTVAYSVHQRASYVGTRAEMTAMHLLEYLDGKLPGYVLDAGGSKAVTEVLNNRLPNYAELFGSPDLCECEHCRSVYSAAAYFVDLMRFLWRGAPNDDARSPLDILSTRRPDLVHLPLTCENTNTLIPYVDLVNEIMEYYTVHDGLTGFKGYDTGDSKSEELRANPQQVNSNAYEILKDEVYPFALPYHQPLDLIRSFSDRLNTSRYAIMAAINPSPDATTSRALSAEGLRLSEEQYGILAGELFDGSATGTPVHTYFGYAATGDLENLSAVREFMARSGVSYVELIALVQTIFINPHQHTLNFIEAVFADSTLTANQIYDRLTQIAAGTLSAADDSDIMAAIAAYNTSAGMEITAVEFNQWVRNHFASFQKVITLYEPESKCSLDTTVLRSMESIYSGATGSMIPAGTWSRLHRFIRLWRYLGWKIHELDLILSALGHSEITADTIDNLLAVKQLSDQTGLELNRLATFWGDIDTAGDKPLYHKLFLNRAAQSIDPAFMADAWGNYLVNTGAVMAAHESTLLGAIRISAEELGIILDAAEVQEGGVPRRLDMGTDALNLPHVTTIYRYKTLAKALKLKLEDLTRLIAIFDQSPFSVWDIDANAYISVDPAATLAFYHLATRIKASGFKSSNLDYIFNGTIDPDSTIALDSEKSLSAVKALRTVFQAIDSDYGDTLEDPTVDAVQEKLTLTFGANVVAELMAILEESVSHEALADANLNIALTPPLSEKYTYVKGSGRLMLNGVMSDDERTALKALPNINASFEAAVDTLYATPETFITDNFGGIFTDPAAAFALLLNRPAQTPTATLSEKLTFVYTQFIPIIKNKLRQDALVQEVAALVGTTHETATLLLGSLNTDLLAGLSAQGLTGEYFTDPTWGGSGLIRIDAAVDFDWGLGAPATTIPADNFSVRWAAFLAPEVTGEHTLIVEATESDEAFALYVDEELVVEKTAGDTGISKEIVLDLNAAGLHALRLDYVEAAQNAGISLFWKTPSTEKSIIPASALYPESSVVLFLADMEIVHRASLFIDGFELSETEIQHLQSYRADFNNIDFLDLKAADWERVHAYAQLRSSVPQSQALLTDLFELASTAVVDIDGLKSALSDVTAWDETTTAYVIDSVFGWTVADFTNEIAISQLGDIVNLVNKTGIAVETIEAWGQVTTDFQTLNALAQELKNAVRAKYTEPDWLTLAGGLNDGIRERQKQALIQHLLTKDAIRQWGAADADGLFEYFLIDVQMMPCMDTSRVVQANAAIQMFVNRCLLNLESDRTTGDQKGVSPEAIDKSRWEWMKNYRVWEANRKVFLYPENWLEPEWRNDRSEFFRELESYLVQNDITERNVETAFRNYLTRLNEVSSLEICSSYEELYSNGTFRRLHVVARTHAAPYRFYYRTWNEYQKWSAWEQVQVDIRVVEEGEESGVHLLPVVWKERLFLFWLELSEKLVEKSNKDQTIESSAKNDTVSVLEPRKDWEARLAWSEYVDRKWEPKQVSKEVADIPGGLGPQSCLSIRSQVNYFSQELKLTVWNNQYFSHIVYFELPDITAPIRINYPMMISVPALPSYWSDYNSFFQKRARQSPLTLMDDTYLERSTIHKLANATNTERNENKLNSPFFFSDAWRSYFVRPVPITIIEWIKNPDIFLPLDPTIVDIPWHNPDEPWIDPPKPDDPLIGGIINPDPAPRPMPDAQPTLGGGTITGPRPGDMDNGAKLPVLVDSQHGLASIGLGSADSIRLPVTNSVHGGEWIADEPLLLMMRTENPEDNRAMRMGAEPVAMVQNVGGLDIVKQPFAEVAVGGGFLWWTKSRSDTGLEFHTFYHPYTSEYTRRLNQGGIEELMASDTALPTDDGATFEGNYDPVFEHGLVQKPSDFDTRTFYKENVCFDVYGANSIYNWELFFHAPLYIATRLSQNGQYEAAMKWFHYIFDPTTDALPEAGESEVARYWKVLPFKITPAESLEDWFRSLSPNANAASENAIIGEWRDNPFDPHLVASNRPLAYMKQVVIKYVENLINWGDFLFRQFTRESVFEALQLYVMANHILGPKPEFIPRRGNIKAETYHSLEDKWDDFSNALVALENIFPYSSDVVPADTSPGGSLLGVGSALYFCIPSNDKLMGYWDTVADRLFKIRHCQDIDGVERSLALFAPPIDPAALIKARSQGLSIGSILADLSSPPPIYRFRYLIQKANEFCADVVALGSAVLSALEKKDAEALSRLRASHETTMLNLLTAVRERNVLEAKANLESAQKGRQIAEHRMRHYLGLLGMEDLEIPELPTIGSEPLNADSRLPLDTIISEISTAVDDAVTDLTGVKMIPKEMEEMAMSEAAKWLHFGAGMAEVLAGIFHLFPQIDGEGTPMGVGAGAWWGGQNLGAATSTLASGASTFASFFSAQAAQAGRMAGFIRREQEWTLQANLAAREIIQHDKQITAAEIRVSITEAELENHKQSILHAEEIEQFLEDKFTNEELYQWMKEQIASVYKQSYNLAYDMAKKAEKAFHYEVGLSESSFIDYGYWDNSHQGLVSGDKLRLALRQLEKAYLEENRREREVSKPISIGMLNPLALIELRETGKCYVSLPEELFDLDFQGHYFRRIKAVGLSIPCVVGPNTSVNCTLRLLSNRYRINTVLNSEGNYEHENDEGLLIDDARFRTEYVPVTSIATSSAQVDRGMFEFNFQDDRYLPFEGAGAISDWMIELSTEQEFRQFDYDSIADVVIRVDYTARESGGLFKEKATDYIKDYLSNAADLVDQPLLGMVSLRHQFATEWHRWLHPDSDADQVLDVTIGKQSFPYFTQNRTIIIQQIDVFAKCTQASDYHLLLAYENEDQTMTTSTQVTMSENDTYGGIHKATLGVADAGLNLEDIAVDRRLTLQLKHSTHSDYQSLVADPEEIEAVYCVFHYKLGD